LQSGGATVVDPQRHFATTNYRFAKGLFDHLVGACEQWRWNGQAIAFQDWPNTPVGQLRETGSSPRHS
jgi:hypothetical protein